MIKIFPLLHRINTKTKQCDIDFIANFKAHKTLSPFLKKKEPIFAQSKNKLTTSPNQNQKK